MPATSMNLSGVDARLLLFVTERVPFAADLVARALKATAHKTLETPAAIDAFRRPFATTLRDLAAKAWPEIDAGAEVTPGVDAAARRTQAIDALVAACDGQLAREAIVRSLTPDERREILRGMILTRAVDTRLKTFFTGSEVNTAQRRFKAKGFDRSARKRSTPPGFVCTAARRIAPPTAPGRATSSRRSSATSAPRSRCGRRPRPCAWCSTRRWARPARRWTGATCTSAISAGASCPRRRRSRSAVSRWPAWASRSRTRAQRVGVSFIGEGGSSLGEWHEAIKLCATRKLPVMFCLENNQTALSTPVADQSAVRVFADKADGYGIPG